MGYTFPSTVLTPCHYSLCKYLHLRLQYRFVKQENGHHNWPTPQPALGPQACTSPTGSGVKRVVLFVSFFLLCVFSFFSFFPPPTFFFLSYFLFFSSFLKKATGRLTEQLTQKEEPALEPHQMAMGAAGIFSGCEGSQTQSML